MRERLRIVVSGMVAGVPHQGGAAWAVLQYVLGLERLGHEVWLVEPVQRSALRPLHAPLARSTAAAMFTATVAAFGLRERSALLVAGSDETVGAPLADVVDAACSADLLVNLSGMLRDPRLTEAIPTRLYVDLDPAFTQMWHEEGRDVGLAGHSHFATVGLAVGEPSCAVPTCARSWITTPPPVVLDHWPVASVAHRDAFTTVANWRSYGPLMRHGVEHGQKVRSFRALMTLPHLVDAQFALALAIHPEETADIESLTAHGWQLLDPLQVAATPCTYRGFVQGSAAELGVAKHGYVVSRCGWFSDRSAAYLASGRPVLAQDTGFRAFLPAGFGLLAFDDLDGAAAGVGAIRADLERHSRAARCVAEEAFDSDRVLGALLERVRVAP